MGAASDLRRAQSGLSYRERGPSGHADGLLVLHHGRGADELDLLTLADAFDPARRMHVVSPRAPLQLEGWQGYHWYGVPRVGYPDPETFKSSRRLLAALHEELWQRTGLGPERTVLGGFSMGAVMSYALSLSGDRPAPAGTLAFSGFLPTVLGWQPDLGSRAQLPVFIAHGDRDAVIDVSFARQARRELEAGGLRVDYHEFPGTHHIEPRQIPLASDWIAERLPEGR